MLLNILFFMLLQLLRHLNKDIRITLLCYKIYCTSVCFPLSFSLYLSGVKISCSLRIHFIQPSREAATRGVLWRLATLLKRYSNTSVFLWILKNNYFEKHLQTVASAFCSIVCLKCGINSYQQHRDHSKMTSPK